MASPGPIVFTGSRGELVLQEDGGAEIVLADLVNASVSVTEQFEPLVTCGKYLVQEHVPVGRDVTFSARTVVRREKDPAAFGMGSHDVVEALAKKVMVARIRDSAGGLLGQVSGVRYAGHAFDISPRAISYNDLQFVAIDYRSETEL